MLKSLELVGFKSFADRTRLEFSSGVTAVVGPNGSGKSNIVDAIKWVLGSQSAKSLRGGEMTDVIFNGSATRRAMNAAEVTLTIGNSKGLFDIDAAEVALTRRVLRSGESEYLINRQPCRLRDIRDLLAGTGVGTEAYSIIEQGRVDALLQASPHQRRAIFEEAAGISRFRGKRQEALRRLDRVDQNLLRLSDIVDEVETRLRSVRAQAGKAESFRNQSRRLEELRTSLGLVDWTRLTRQLDEAAHRLSQLEREQTAQRSLVEQAATRVPELERQIEQLDDQLTTIDRRSTRLAEARVTSSVFAQQGRQRLSDVEQQRAEVHADWRSLLTRDDHQPTVNAQVEELARQVDSLRFAETQARQSAAAHKAHRRHAIAQRDEVARRLAEAEHRLELLGYEVATLGERCSELDSHLATTVDGAARTADDVKHRQADLAAARQQVAEHEQQLRDATQACEEQQTKVTAAEAQLENHRDAAQDLSTHVARIEQRVEVAAEFQSRLRQRDHQITLFLRDALGDSSADITTVADILHVDVDIASMIEAALGAAARQIVLDKSGSDDAWIASLSGRLPARATLARLDFAPLPSRLERVDLSGEAGVIGRADHFVDAESRYEPLVRRLLGQTWLVDQLATALRLARGAGLGLRFVTVACEVVGVDGTLELGPLDNQLQLLGGAEHQEQLRAQLDADQSKLRQAVSARDRSQVELNAIREELARRDRHRSECDSQLTQARQLRDAAERSVAEARRRAAEADSLRVRASTDHETAAQQHRKLQQQRELLAQQGQQLATSLRQLESAAETALHQERNTVGHHRQVELDLAGQEQQLTALRKVAESESARTARRDEQDLPARLADAERQIVEATLATLAATSDWSTASWQLQLLATERSRLADQRGELRDRRQQFARALEETRREIEQCDATRQELQVAATQTEYQRQMLADRLREDYEIDIAAVAAETSAPELPVERQQIEREIESLRQSINRIGAVNTDALEELEGVEQRFEQISSQYNDLSQAKESLERLISRLNNDSRQLFFDTIESVRGHFQELFRRLFGGGTADLVVEQAEGADPLECGIEIQACPPGKEMRNITLLSGGEKTLTCVALLLAMFRSKPSPFCLLDEVDAALDEANIGRFTNVLHDFLSSTQFIVVTHSKKTMTGADTLYGITMQESGISKQVSVRFDDVAEDGTIRNPKAEEPASLRPAA